MLKKYFDFQEFYDIEIKPLISPSMIEDYDIILEDITKEEALKYLENPPFPLDILESDISMNSFSNRRSPYILFNFSKEYDNSTESGYDVSYVCFYVVYNIEDESITHIGIEQG